MARLIKKKQKTKNKKFKINNNLKTILLSIMIIISIFSIAIMIFCSYYKNPNGNFQQPQKVIEEIKEKNKQKTKVDFNNSKINITTSNDKKVAQDNEMNFPIDYQKPSEKINYPSITNNFWIDVNIKNQRVYLMQGNNLAYTMYCSTGTESEPTPTGLFHIQAEKGDSFYNPKTNMGANYWTSFKDNGVYLFHTVPTDKQGNYIINEAHKLGKQSGSHGCIRLSIPDAKFIYENVKTGTPVFIQKNGNIPDYSEIKKV